MASAPLGVGLVDRSFRYVWVNEAFASLHHPLAADQHPGRSVEQVVPQRWASLRPLLERVLEGETIVNREVSEVDADDLSRPRVWLATYYPVREGDRVVGVGVVTNEVTGLRATEQALLASKDLHAMLARTNRAVSVAESAEELFRTATEIAVDSGQFMFAWIGVPDGDRVRVVAQSGDDHGYLDDLADSGLMVSLDPESPMSQGPTGRALLTGVRSVVNDISTSRLSDRWREAADRAGWHGSAAFPIRERGRVVAVLTVYARAPNFFTPELIETLGEITPSLSFGLDRFAAQADRAQREADLLLRDRALNASSQGVLICDMTAFDSPAIYASPSFERVTGYSNAEIIGRNCRFLQGPDTDPATVSEIRAAVAAGKHCNVEILNYRKNGEPFWNNLSLSPIFDSNGKLTHFVGVQTDVTERRRLEQELRHAQKMEAVGQLASGVAHDFNNVLTAIRGAVSIALTEITEPAATTELRRIEAAAEHATALTGQLLAFGRRQLLRPQVMEMNPVVTDTVGLVASLLRNDVTIETRLAPAVPNVIADRGQLQQVILNLAINAEDAMPSGGAIIVSTGQTRLDESYTAQRVALEPGHYVTLEFADNGAGMDEATQRQIFDPFFTTKQEGSGLGLATVYGIVKQIGGHIAVYSELGAGTTFRIYLPVAEAGETPVVPEEAEPGDVAGSETVLYVEDAELLRSLVPRMLEPYGYSVLTAANATEALAVDEDADRIDLLLSDSIMPGMRGLELARVLRARRPELKLLLTSGHPDAGAEVLADGEPLEFIQKPFLAGELAAKIRRLLDA